MPIQTLAYGLFKDENKEVEQNEDLISNYNTNYHYAEGNDLKKHPYSVVRSLCNLEEHNHLRNVLMNSF